MAVVAVIVVAVKVVVVALLIVADPIISRCGDPELLGWVGITE